ncbi:metal ABC transporter solute-binding protein, Zn/Mn family [Sporosarcina sp. ITBMC105]
MKRTKWLLFVGLVLTLIVGACGQTNKNEEAATVTDGTLSIYTTVYPLQFFTEQIGGEHVHVQSIYPAGADEHTFDPTQKDMMALADADLFFYIGLGLEGFVENAQKTLKSEHVEMIATAESISEDRLGENHHHHDEDGHDEHGEDEHGHGEEGHDEHGEDEHGHGEEGHDEHGEDEHGHGEEGHDEHSEEAHHDHDHGEFDPHVWISPTLSIELAKSIKEALIAKMPEQKETFEKNYDALADQLMDLDERFADMANKAPSKTFFVSHAAFGYIANAYGLNQVAIAGLNSQSEPSQKELTKIVDQAKEENIQYVLFEQNVSSKLTDVVRKEIGAESLQLHNLGVLTPEDVQNKETYFTLMERNLSVFEQALSK